jgi:hypothetical protein
LAVAARHRASSASLSCVIELPRSRASFENGTSIASNPFSPAQVETATPELSSITFLSFGGSESYFAWFMPNMKMLLAKRGEPLGTSTWCFTISCSLVAGIASHGTIAPWITPLEMASGTCGSGICTGVPPRAATMRALMRVAVRIFMPRRSSSRATGLLECSR